ncbi:MAG TPA: hypothetical protein VKB24_05625 [Candidatus Acidoferrum sp.]|nr:hypothetical protein [Candidatus Acidoferrum sp.]
MLWRRTGFLIAVLAATGTAGGQEHRHPAPETLGKVSFPTSCSPPAAEPFERGVALLHSFAYEAAERQFAGVLRTDPNCAMAHWGVAMSYVHQMWEPRIRSVDLARGAQEIALARQIRVSDREAGFIEALGEFYRHSATTPDERGQAYAEAMKRLAARQTGDSEAQVFYALALLSAAPSSDPSRSDHKAAAQILEPLFQKYPDHPGVAHYLIHACDNPEMAGRGLPAARAYAQIAPAAPHALHMPSHIFTLLGLWQDSIRSNQDARRAAHQQGDTGEELHAMDYLEYAYLQAGDYRAAAVLLEELNAMSKLPLGDLKVGYAATAMPVRYGVERRDWTRSAALPVYEESLPQVAAMALWGRAVGQARGGNPAAAEEQAARLALCLERLRAANDAYWSAQVEIQIAEANAWIAHAKRREEEAIAALRLAAAREDDLEKRPVTPGAIVPAREQLGELLLELGRPDEALTQFEATLKNAPGRRGALAGALHAADLAGNAGKAQEFKARLLTGTAREGP